ncbi:DUF2059 domain-containing protein [Consotaella salsifontis]|uniref:DUF2059 domain-containing protein n=1 Tax=Consotaella salsifontis TaxID=1365950 RepID=A0A1T4PA12_9HYPH|nr:DUF2059 domain-containing protein [Consotaella salsifontis]SJZ88364.1 hypothetical protein SAMN05428963_103414 [Consotaella salsifontis]
MLFRNTMRQGAVALAIAGLVWASPLRAEDYSASHLAAARQAIEAIQATDGFDNILLNAATQIKAELITNNPNLQTQISDMVDDSALKIAGRRADLENEVARVYAKLFTEQELGEIATFYSSDTGKKLLKQGPMAARETMQAADVWAKGIIRDLRKAAQDGMKKLAPQGAGGAAPAK